jgi:hypothetical protein
MANYQHDEKLEIQEVGETTRPNRAPMLNAFEDNYLAPLDAAILAKDKTKTEDSLRTRFGAAAHATQFLASANWSSYGSV